MKKYMIQICMQGMDIFLWDGVKREGWYVVELDPVMVAHYHQLKEETLEIEKLINHKAMLHRIEDEQEEQ